MLAGKKVVIIGAGVAGLTAADALARRGAAVQLIDKAADPGGHAERFSCKATERCVACGACVARERMLRVRAHRQVVLRGNTRIVDIARTPDGFTVHGRGPEGRAALSADALLVASGFTPYDPSDKPYGYGRFPNVRTSLEAEAILRSHGAMVRPSDGRPPERMAFIQCVGSRDARIGHPWCSKICCGSALRMAALIQHRQPDVAVTFFYIDVQTFGRQFEQYYAQTRRRVRMVRAIPGDIFATEAERLLVSYFDPGTQQPAEDIFDLVVLSVGLTPPPENRTLARMLEWPVTDLGFLQSHTNGNSRLTPGIFIAGAALGPMGIAESMESAAVAVWDMMRYFRDPARK